MAAITRVTAASLINNALRNRLNGNIGYGTNYFLSDFTSAYFGGTTAGIYENFTASDIPEGPINASVLVNAISAYMRKWGRIRLTQFVSYYSANTGTSVRQNVTTYSYLNTSVPSNAYQPAGSNNNTSGAAFTQTGWFDPYMHAIGDQAGGAPSAGSSVITSAITNYCNNLFNQYVSLNTNNKLVLTRTFCHSNCHDNCHTSRGRR